MRPWVGVLLVAVGGAVGAILRHGCNELSAWLTVTKFGRVWPVSTLVVNLLGCLAIGALMAYARRGQLSDEWRLLLVTGGLGSLTTFSAFSVETLLLARETSPGAAVINVVANVVGCLLAVWLGWALVGHA